MPKFQYVAMDQSGQEVKDEIEAGSTEDALAKIRGMGYFPTKIKEKGAKKKLGIVSAEEALAHEEQVKNDEMMAMAADDATGDSF